MTSPVFMAFTASLALILETLIRSAGFHLPLLAFAVFYFAYVNGPAAGTILALIFGFLIEALFGFSTPFAVLTTALSIPVAWILLNWIEADTPLLLLPAGALFPLIVTLPWILFRGGCSMALERMPHLFLAAVLSTFLLPGIIAFLDVCSEKLGLPIFSEVKEKRRHSYE